MFSSNNNLQDELAKSELELLREINTNDYVPTMNCTKKYYDNLQTKDPTQLYFTEDGIFYGDLEVKSMNIDSKDLKYFLTYDGNRYIIFYKYNFICKDCTKMHMSQLIKICEVSDSDKGIRLMNLFNQIGYHDKEYLMVYEMIDSFINKDIYINDFIIGLISMFGYKDDPRLQELINLGISYRANEATSEFSKEFRNELQFLKDECINNNRNSLIPLYYDLHTEITNQIYMYNKYTTIARKKNAKKELLEHIFSLINKCY